MTTGAVDLAAAMRGLERPTKAVVTAGMPYANGPLHLGHLAGAHVPADIHARWLGMLIGRDNVLFVCGTDDHGSTSELAAAQAGKPIREFIDALHAKQEATLARYAIALDIYSGTSRPDCLPIQTRLCQAMLRQLHHNRLLEKRTVQQWFDLKLSRFLPDRLVRGKCPNPKCDNEDAYSDECEKCGHQHAPSELVHPRSALSDTTPTMRNTAHWFLDMWAVADVLRQWVVGKQGAWRSGTLSDVLNMVLPCLRLEGATEPQYKELRAELPKHKLKYGQRKQLLLQFESMEAMGAARQALAARGISASPVEDWAHRSITRDVSWGIPVPADLDPDLAGKTLYVWPDSLIAPVAFSQVALRRKGRDPETYRDYWCDPRARVYQFLGQDNVFFYTLMQGALWLGSQSDPQRLPMPGELQLTDVFASFHLLVSREKMSKSRGNFLTGDQLLEDHGYSGDQVRYYLATLGLSAKSSSFDLPGLAEKSALLAGPMNAAFERPISAAHSKFGGVVPEGRLSETVVADTARMIRRYVGAMSRAEYPSLLNDVENYARTINSLFTQFKPHDDRHPLEGRRDALTTSFYVLKNLLIMLYPFAPTTMDRLRESLRLPPSVFAIDQLGTPMPSGHALGPKLPYFPAAGASSPV